MTEEGAIWLLAETYKNVFRIFHKHYLSIVTEPKPTLRLLPISSGKFRGHIKEDRMPYITLNAIYKAINEIQGEKVCKISPFVVNSPSG